MLVELLRVSAKIFDFYFSNVNNLIGGAGEKEKKLAAEKFFFFFLVRVYLNLNLKACVNRAQTMLSDLKSQFCSCCIH